MKKINLKLIFFWFIFLFGIAGKWFQKNPNLLIEADEVAWIMDAKFFQYRKQKKWNKFQLQPINLNSGWASEKYRLVDQPQLGKYLFGLILTQADLEPWKLGQRSFFYQQFMRMKLNLGSIQEVSLEYPELATSLALLRKLGAISSFVSIVLFGWLIGRMVKSHFLGGVASLLAFFNPVLFHLYHLAVPNNWQILFLISGLWFLFLSKKNHYKKSVFIWWFGTGLLFAAVTSIKLNGAFLILLPLFLWLNQVDFINLRKNIKKYLVFLTGFMAFFYYLEAEIWRKPFVGTRLLFLSRINQQRRFLFSYANSSYLETLWFLLSSFLKISSWLWLKIILIFFLAGGVFFLLKNISNKKWSSLGLISFYLLVANSFYAGVAFERYAEWAILVLSFIAILGVRFFGKICFKLVQERIAK